MSTVLGNSSAQLRITTAGLSIRLNGVDKAVFDPADNTLDLNGLTVQNLSVEQQ